MPARRKLSSDRSSAQNSKSTCDASQGLSRAESELPLRQAAVQARLEPRLQPLACLSSAFSRASTPPTRPEQCGLAMGRLHEQPSRRRSPPPICISWHCSYCARYWQPTCIDGGGSLRPSFTPAAQTGDGLVAPPAHGQIVGRRVAQLHVVSRLY